MEENKLGDTFSGDSHDRYWVTNLVEVPRLQDVLRKSTKYIRLVDVKTSGSLSAAGEPLALVVIRGCDKELEDKLSRSGYFYIIMDKFEETL